MNLPSSLVLVTCVSLAARSTEQHRKIRDILNCAYVVYHSDAQFMQVNDEFFRIRDSCTKCEFVMLRLLNFELLVELPHAWIMRICRVQMDDTLMAK